MLNFGKGICYSGYRNNQSPRDRIYPSYDEVLEDLTILEGQFDYLRMYDPYNHAQTVLQVIRDHHLKLKVMVGVEPRGEISNPNCPWGGLHSDDEIKINRTQNYRQLDLLADLVKEYEDLILAVSVGNENTSEWHHNLMPAEVLADHVRYLKKKVSVPVTFCEGAYAWIHHCKPIAAEVDFISIHSYPLWLRTPLAKALEVNQNDYNQAQATYPDKQIIFTEFGWATSSTGQMNEEDTNEDAQAIYLSEVDQWAENNQIIMFLFEAFDEPWKGGDNPLEPEKHWGVYSEDRIPKKYYRLRNHHE